MTRPARFHWFLPTGGDGRSLAAGVHGLGIGSTVRASWTGQQFDHTGAHYELEGALLRRPPDPVPEVYLGGSSDAALPVAARQADCYLTWGEPPALVAEKVDRVRELAAAEGRPMRFGLRIHVITRDTEAQAWADADRLIAGLDDATVAARQAYAFAEGVRPLLG